MKAWLTRLYQRLESEDRQHRTAYAFMPAALEIEETPPSPIGRLIVWLIVALFVIAVIWAAVGRIDVVAVAPGKVIPSERVKVIQPLEIGVVHAIHVANGDAVEAGQPLITLDGTRAEADVRRMQAELTTARLDVARTKALQQFLETRQQTTPDWPAASEHQQRVQSRLLAQEIGVFVSEQENLEDLVRQREAERASVAAEIAKHEKTLPIITKRAESLRRLLAQDLVAESTYLELEQQRIEAVQNLAVQTARAAEVAAAIASLESRQRTHRADARKTNLARLQESERRVAVLEQELVKAWQRYRQHVLRAPIDGVVYDLAVFTVGGVVTPAQKLLSVVPSDSALEVQALVLNKDIGFVHEGQPAEVKIDAFNFTKYGVIDARVSDLSNNALSDEQLGLVYQARVLLERSAIEVNDKLVNLSPGMSVTVEIQTGTRRIIEFFLSPLLRYRDESIRER